MSNSYEKFKNSSYCVGGRHHTSTTNIKPKITYNKKTNKEVKLFEGKCSLNVKELKQELYQIIPFKLKGYKISLKD